MHMGNMGRKILHFQAFYQQKCPAPGTELELTSSVSRCLLQTWEHSSMDESNKMSHGMRDGGHNSWLGPMVWLTSPRQPEVPQLLTWA